MPDWMGVFDLEFLRELLSTSGKASLTEKIILIGIVWRVMGRKVSNHFMSLEIGMKNGFAQLKESIDGVRKTLHEVETSHAKQLTELNGRVAKLEDTTKQLVFRDAVYEDAP